MFKLKFFVFLTLLVSCVPSESTFGAKPSDFFCMGEPKGPFNPLTRVSKASGVKMALKRCPGETQTEEDVCIVKAECVFMTDELKSYIAEEYEKDFSKVTPREKLKYLHTYGIEGLPTDMLCKPIRIRRGTLYCPTPEHCKGEILHGLTPAIIAPESLQELWLKQRIGLTGTFHPGDRVRSGVAK